MKVEIKQQKVKISPIVITLETLGEAIAMWHRMNLAECYVHENTSDVETFSSNEDWNLSQQLFDVIDNELSELGIKPGTGLVD